MKGTLTAYATLERKAEELLTQDNLCTSLRQERDQCRALLTMFREQEVHKAHLWVATGGIFVRTDKATAFTQTMKMLETTLTQLKKAETARRAIAEELMKDPGLSIVGSDPQVNRILTEMFQDE